MIPLVKDQAKKKNRPPKVPITDHRAAEPLNRRLCGVRLPIMAGTSDREYPHPGDERYPDRSLHLSNDDRP